MRNYAASVKTSLLVITLAGSALISPAAETNANRTTTQMSEFQAGFATADITPPVGWRRAGGYHEVVSAAGGDPLCAKAMVLSQGGTTVAVVGNDLCSVPREITDRARKLASAKTGIPAATIKKITPLVIVNTPKKPPKKGMVWVTPDTKVDHKEGSQWYGNTDEGKWMVEADAKKDGNRPAKE